MKRTISKSERPYRLLLCVMISLLVIMLAGCSTSSDSDTNTRGFTDFATIEEEYLTTIESLNWPEGFTPPDALEGEDTGASFQIGYGDTRASNLWEYSWMQEWLDTYNTDSERAAKALAELEKAFDMPYMGTDRCDDATCVCIETIFSSRVADLTDRVTDDLLNIDISLCRNLAHNEYKTGRGRCLTCNTAHRILLKQCIKNRI